MAENGSKCLKMVNFGQRSGLKTNLTINLGEINSLTTGGCEQ